MVKRFGSGPVEGVRQSQHKRFRLGQRASGVLQERVERSVQGWMNYQNQIVLLLLLLKQHGYHVARESLHSVLPLIINVYAR
jgi:hypothetical protein